MLLNIKLQLSCENQTQLNNCMCCLLNADEPEIE